MPSQFDIIVAISDAYQMYTTIQFPEIGSKSQKGTKSSR